MVCTESRQSGNLRSCRRLTNDGGSCWDFCGFRGHAWLKPDGPDGGRPEARFSTGCCSPLEMPSIQVPLLKLLLKDAEGGGP
mmetsp:Transcript_101321/g.180079  ORF Transcript_101321/g.180079 Transcript_101321/m.180079 type:complete len:82 (+) Transcript_101321:1632-1877(+)